MQLKSTKLTFILALLLVSFIPGKLCTHDEAGHSIRGASSVAPVACARSIGSCACPHAKCTWYIPAGRPAATPRRTRPSHQPPPLAACHPSPAQSLASFISDHRSVQQEHQGSSESCTCFQLCLAS